MPRVIPHPPRYLTTADGVRWRVYDRRAPVAGQPPTAHPPGTDGACYRVFVREGDGWAFVARLYQDRPGDLAPATLARQLARALSGMPTARRGEALNAYIARQAAHMAAHPQLFPASRWDVPGPAAEPAPGAPVRP